MKKTLLLLLMISFGFSVSAQPEKKVINAIPIGEAIKIDGVLDESVWATAPVADNFLQRAPYNGKAATYSTQVRLLYNNSGLYVGAQMDDPHPDSIPAQLGLRDNSDLNADYFILVLSPFNDGINAFCFLVYISDVQVDFKIPGADGNDDYSWDAVWQSKAKKNEHGWTVEMKIPYSAIRFPKKPVQEWGLNFQRSFRRARETDTWNFVDAKVSGFTNQCGLLHGIQDITPPLRLSLTPYVSGYLENSAGSSSYEFSYNYGADLKYGINQSFTLDMTLIPDFGQVRSDDKIYNFSPFEIQYDERRQFFTEGTELFNKGGIFYSRRVGNEPKGYSKAYNDLQKNEMVTDNPSQTKLVNATKISGRTTKGLGIGLFNAMSANTWATITDTTTGESRRFLTQGFTNYNMFVLDQNLKNNSYLDFLNTNYYQPTEGYMANVTGTSFKFANKKYTYAFSGDGFVSQKYYSHTTPEFGYHYSLAFGKISGNFQYSYSQLLETDKYDPNDMGFNTINNRFNNTLSLEYNFYTPFWKVINWYNFAKVSYNCLYDGFKYTALNINAESNTTSKRYLTFGANFDAQPIESHDYYEPRVPGWMYIAPAYASQNLWISSDYRKKFAIDINATGLIVSKYAASGWSAGISPRYRISDKIFLVYQFSYDKMLNNVGYVMDSLDVTNHPVILFGRRDRQTIANILEANFMLTSNMSVDIRGRHYWVSAPYYSFFRLQEDGRLEPTDYSGDRDVDYNLFNVDLTYIWNFAPGSQISIMWKNAITTFDNSIDQNFFNNFSSTINSPSSNSFSIRIFYYLDALYLQKKNRGKNPTVA
ncbi:MAG: DUF5916 domain-containing protein [Bacteroidales bacterium]|nr:DUF5916 domain-containing protein [Bacteroidales bacterium]